MASMKEIKSVLFSLTSERSFPSEISQYLWIDEFRKSKNGFIKKEKRSKTRKGFPTGRSLVYSKNMV
jgi:hypothetical protein